jgi:hypothetical protein
LRTMIPTGAGGLITVSDPSALTLAIGRFPGVSDTILTLDVQASSN